MSRRIRYLIQATITIALLYANQGGAADAVKLTVGYQPYDTISYSAVVIRALDLWKKYLPPGSEVEFQSALQGSIIVNQMLANKQQIGYLGDMPAVVATTKRSVAPINLVANTGMSAGQRCNVVMVRADAPKFKSSEEAIKWLDGKVVATPQGSCAHRFLGLMIEKTKIKPSQILNQSIEVIATNLRTGKVDGAVLWEPSVSRIGDIVGEGSARVVATGYTFGIPDAGAIAMREDFLKQRPDIAEAWLKTELEAQRYVLDPKNWTKVAEFVKAQTAGITVPMAWFSIYGAIPPAAGGSPVRDEKPFVFDDRVQKLLTETYVYLYGAKVIDTDKAAPGAIDDSIARKVVKDAKVTTPLGTIAAQDVSKAPK
jgi:NitT/TauT family transport system substrate-binding protein